MRLSYGLKVAAILITGGTAIYYAAGPRLTVTAPDIVELAEGINERRAAIGTWPFTGGTNGWSFTRFKTGSLVLPIWGNPYDYYYDGEVAMSIIMQDIIDLATSFVKERSPTNVVMWTAPSLFQACGVGPADGTQALYTVAVQTNGTRVYSNYPALTVWTGLLGECYRLLAAMTTTVKRVTWDSSTPRRRMLVYQTQYQYATDSESEPAWYTAFTNDGTLDGVPSDDFQRTRGLTVPAFSQTALLGAAGPMETIKANAPFSYRAEHVSIGGWRLYYEYFNLDWYRTDTNSVTLRFPSLATGCVISVDYQIPVIGDFTVTNFRHAASTWHYGFTNALTTNFNCTGVSTGWWHEVSLYPTASLDLVYSGWTNFLPGTDAGGWPSIGGSVSATLPNYLFINWTFTSCRP